MESAGLVTHVRTGGSWAGPSCHEACENPKGCRKLAQSGSKIDIFSLFSMLGGSVNR